MGGVGYLVGHLSPLVRSEMGTSPMDRKVEGASRTLEVSHLSWTPGKSMIILYYPRATRPSNRRFPLSVLALAAVLEGREEYRIVDGNLDLDPDKTIADLIRRYHVELLGVSVMPGPQMVAAMNSCKNIRRQFPQVPVVWGGYFPSIYPDATLNAPYIDYAVRGQGEQTLLELIEAIRGQRA